MGVGNVLMRDDGAGVRTVERMKELGLAPEGMLADGGTSAFDVLVGYGGGAKLVVIDAVRGGGEPGTVYRIPLEELGRDGAANRLSIHDVGLLDALAMLTLAGAGWAEVVVLGVEPAVVSWGEELSEPVARAVPRLADMALAEAGLPGARGNRI